MSIVTIASFLVVLATFPVAFIIPIMSATTIIASRRAVKLLAEHRKLERAINIEVYRACYPVDIPRAQDYPSDQ